jgi:hypothetical protein
MTGKSANIVIHIFARIVMKITITANIQEEPGLAHYLDHCLSSTEKRTLLKAAVYASLQDIISYYDGAHRHLDIQLALEPKSSLSA